MSDTDTSTFAADLQAKYSLVGRMKGKARSRRPTKPCQHEGCNGWAWAQGYCDHHYQKLKRLGIIKVKRILNDPVRRFHQRYEVNAETLCWEWTGTIHPRGYGTLGIGGRVKHIKAHRFSYEMFFGPIPEGQKVLHECDNRRCVNPAHFFLGTDADNAKDCVAKGRHSSLLGTNKPKLTKPMIQTIRILYARGRHSYRLLGLIYGVDEETTRSIVKGQTHLTA